MLHQKHRQAPLLLSTALSIFPAAAQAPSPPSNPPEIQTRDAPASFRAGVNLVLVPVVVRDPQGRAVGNLRREDFQLEDKGKQQVITRFSVERPGSAAGAVTAEPAGRIAADPVSQPTDTPPQHFVAYFFDDIHLGATDLLRARAAAERHLAESLDPADRAAIYTASGRTALEFTNDRERLRQALDRIQLYTSAGYSPTDCPHVDFYAADLIVNKHDRQALSVATNDALRCLAADLKHPSATLPQAAEDMARSTAGRVLRVGQSETRQSLSALLDLVNRMAAAPGRRSIVLVSSGFLLMTDDRANETDVMERAIRANVTINSLDARGLFGVVGGEASQPTMNGGQIEFRVQYESAAALRGTDALAELADSTGGRFFHNSNDLREGLQMLAAQPEFLYVLGFAPQDLKDDGSFHRLKISLRNPGAFSVQARRGYYAPRHAASEADEAAEAILEEVFSRGNTHEIPLALNMRYVKTGDFRATLSVVAQVDARGLRFRKDQGRSNDDLTVVAAVFDGSGNFITGGQKVVEMHLRDQTLEVLSASGIRVRNTFDLTPGSYRVRVVARDTEGRTMASADGAVQIP